MIVGIAIGYFCGIFTVVILSCCKISGRESRREEQNELNNHLNKKI